MSRSRTPPALSIAAQRTLRALTAPLLDSISTAPRNSPGRPAIHQSNPLRATKPTTANSAQHSPPSIPPHSPEFPKIPQQNAPAQIESTASRSVSPATSNTQLSPRQLSSIDLLFAGHSFSSVARTLNIDRKTLYHWRKSKPYLDEIRRRATSARTVPNPLHHTNLTDQEVSTLRVLASLLNRPL